MQKLPCLDCKADIFEIGEYFVVTDTTWGEAGMRVIAYVPDEPIIDLNSGRTYKGHAVLLQDGDVGDLCVGCLESRLGRLLMPKDFTDAPVNARSNYEDPSIKSARLRDRLGWDRGEHG